MPVKLVPAALTTLAVFMASAEIGGVQGKTKADAAPALELLGFRECMPFLFADKKEKLKEIRKNQVKVKWQTNRILPNKNNNITSLFTLAQVYVSEYEKYVLRSLKLKEKAEADPENELLQKEIEHQRNTIDGIGQNWLSKAIKVLKQFSTIFPDDAKIDGARSLLGEALWWSGEEKEALEALRNLVKNYPKSKELPRAYMFFGEYYLKKGDLNKAREAFSKAALDKGHDCVPCAAYRIGHCHGLSGDTEKALDWFENAVSNAGVGSAVRAFSGRSMRSAQGMVQVPAGWFWMGCNIGSDNDCSFNEKPMRQIYLDEFWIDRTEVTAMQYEKCMKEGKCSKEGLGVKCGHGINSNYKNPCVWYRQDLKSCPVIALSWEQAKGYCEWAGKRLPTEAEWEKAARGTRGGIYPWGNDGYETGKPVANIADKEYGKQAYIPPIAKHDYDDGFPKLAPAGSYPQGASPCGALDMVGNAWEWVSDWYKEGYDKSASNRNPKGPKEGKYRVIRGCSFADLPKVCRASARFRADPKHHKHTIGVRCAADAVK